LSLFWFVFRTGRKPSRAVYPCQQAAALNANLWFAIYVSPIYFYVRDGISFLENRARVILVVAVIVVASAVVYLYYPIPPKKNEPDGVLTGDYDTDIGTSLTNQSSSLSPSTDIFVVRGTNGGDDGIDRLINLMGSQDLAFYLTDSKGRNCGPEGLIAREDVLLIKVNCQWDERGGTNTDLLRSLIRAILDHPEGFSGEIVVADNGQGQYGSSGSGGSLDWSNNNAEDISQSVQAVVDSFAASHRVSTYLWDSITTTRVMEYSEGDLKDGYVVNDTANSMTGIMVSYPKFTTEYGTHISFKHGVWDHETKTYDRYSLKVINVPVLKTHSTYGVTACVKHYMGVPSDKLTTRLGSRTHNTIADGGMGTEMAETRFPVLNILDAIWVNANSPEGTRAGPHTSYQQATEVNIIAASTDPVAMDYWASKNILMQAIPDGSDLTLIDPDYMEASSFGRWLRLSMEEIVKAGYTVVMNEAQMNVYITSQNP
jgi:hypothetical protein